MKKEDLKHPAFPRFIAYADSDVLLTSPLEDAWETYKAGWEASLEAVVKAAEKKEADVLEFPKLEVGEDDCFPIPYDNPKGDKKPEVVHTPTGIMPRTCGRCPDPKHPDPKFHTTGIAHTTP